MNSPEYRRFQSAEEEEEAYETAYKARRRPPDLVPQGFCPFRVGKNRENPRCGTHYCAEEDLLKGDSERQVAKFI
jgi:hypothetical protein